MPVVPNMALPPVNKSLGYEPWYPPKLGLQKIPPRIGFKPSLNVIKKSNVEALIADIQNERIVGLDTETTSLKFAECQIVTVNVGLPGNRNYVGFYYRGFLPPGQAANLATDEQLDDVVRAVLGCRDPVMHNRRYDQQVLMHTRGFREGAFLNVHNTHLLFWGLDTNVKSGLSLKLLGHQYLGLPMWGDSEEEKGIFEDILKADPLTVIRYGCLDAYATVELGLLLVRIYEKHYPFMLQLHRECSSALFSLMEQHQHVDFDWAAKLRRELNAALEEVKKEFYKDYGLINLNSGPQKSALFFRLGYDTGRRCQPNKKTGEAIMGTGEDDLLALIKAPGGCRPAELMIRASKINKQLSSYVNPMYEMGKANKPIRLNFRDASVSTLRFAAGKYSIKNKAYDYYASLSIQCVPKPKQVLRELNFNPDIFQIEWLPDGERGQYCVEAGSPALNIRKMFGKPGHGEGWFVNSDFAQEELVIPANLANERTWIEALKRGEDLHKATGRLVYGRDPDGNERKVCKSANFGIMFELENPELVLAEQTGWPMDQCRAFLAKYKSGLSSLYAWKERVVQEGKLRGYVTNLEGFERRVKPWFESLNKRLRKLGAKTCVNQLIQGQGGLWKRILLIKAWKATMRPGGRWHGSGIYTVLTLHDEMDMWVPPDPSLLREYLPWHKGMMESITPKSWEAPLRAEISLGYNFGEVFAIEPDGNGGWLPKQEKRPSETASVVTPITESVIDSWAEETADELAEFGGLF